MDTLNIPYSRKNIPLPTKFSYQKQLVKATEKFMRNLRWKVFFFLNPTQKGVKKESFGFKSSNNPPFMKEIKPFEDDMFDLVHNIKFKPFTNEFQEKLKSDKAKIEKSNELIIKADKTNNLYKMDAQEYEKHMVNVITKDYKKCDRENFANVNKEAAKIARSFHLEDRIDSLTENSSFLTLKDHKESFPGKLDFRLINPSKNHVAKISKHKLDEINSSLRKVTGYNQWQSTKDMLGWFSKTEVTPGKTSFLKFDIVSFYPSISEKLLSDALKWAKNLTKITDTDIEVILHCRKTFLFYQDEIWVKKSNSEFDVAMGSFDSAEVCELTGLFVLHKLETLVPKENLGLYRDDGLATTNLPGPALDRLRKDICKIFQDLGLKVTIEAGMKNTDFLDVQLNLEDLSYRPFRKDAKVPLYIHKQSNHPPHIKKELPKMIGKRVSQLSSSKAIFENEATIYNAALKNAGYDEELEYVETCPQKRNKRRRNILWFNPPWNDVVSTNVAGKFLHLIDKHFSSGSPLKKILNRNTVKVSYCCMPNMDAILSAHNKKISCPTPSTTTPGSCNCRGGPVKCMLGGQCQTTSLVYKCTVAAPGLESKHYVGLTANTFKERYGSHKSSFTHQKNAHKTTLSTYVWKLRTEGATPSLSWSIVRRAPSYSKETGICQLCLHEKTTILLADQQHSLNKRNEIIAKCRHRDKWLLNKW